MNTDYLKVGVNVHRSSSLAFFLRLINMVCQKHAKNEGYALMKV